MPGLTPGEERIMDLWDAGRSMQTIARDLGATLQRVRRVVTYYNGDGELAAQNHAMAAACAQLAAAINRERQAA